MAPAQEFKLPSPPANGRLLLYRDRRESEESIATELCDGPLLEGSSQRDGVSEIDDVERSENKMPYGIDRETLIEQIKKRQKEQRTHASDFAVASCAETYDSRNSRTLDGEDTSCGTQDQEAFLDRVAAGLQIQRPRSALHSGDFSRRESTSAIGTSTNLRNTSIPISSSPPRPSPLQTELPQTKFRPSIGIAFSSQRSTSPSDRHVKDISLKSASPKYVLKPPTSPLVWESSELELNFDESSPGQKLSKVNRRHTLTPLGLGTNNDYSQFTAAARAPNSLRREETFPLSGYGHRPRRSLAGSWTKYVDGSPTAPPSLRSRTSSFSSDASPRQSSMVGSYEESILRGRMSGTPSHPLTFEAGIGALGRPGCKPMMPEHVRVDFPAVFYSWSDGQGRVGSINQEPSPYVGRIDLEHSLPAPKKREKRRRREEKASNREGYDIDPQAINESSRVRKTLITDSIIHSSAQKGEDPVLGGAYRIPKKGSLQLIIKNPNKTAVKVFIVPYDLEGMLPRQRTWVRQRLYSAGPIVEKPISSRSGGDLSPSGRHEFQARSEKPTLRYLVNFKICCTSKDRFYLYDEIRVVFANRVPDNKEKLRSEVMMPDPRFMPFKATRITAPSNEPAPPSLPTISSKEQTVKRRSHGIDLYTMQEKSMRNLVSQSCGEGLQPLLYEPSTPPTPVPPMPQDFVYDINTRGEEIIDVDTEGSQSNYTLSPNREAWRKNLEELLSSPEGPAHRRAGHNGDRSGDKHRRARQRDSDDPFAKLARDDVRFGGYFGRSGTPEPGEGLIAKRLRSLDMDADEHVHRD